MAADPVLALGLLSLALFQTGEGPRRPLSLHGVWEARVVADAGVFEEGLPAGGPSEGWTRIPIPSVFEERQVFAENPGVVFLRCPFVFDREVSRDKRYRLRFDRVTESCHVWLNGADAGAHFGGDTPFTLDLTGLLVRGQNMLHMAVSREMPGLPNGQPAVGAILGAVEIEEVAPWTVEDLDCCYLPGAGEGVVELRLEVVSTAPADEPLTARFEVFTPLGGGAAVEAAIDFVANARAQAAPSVRVKIPNPVLWGLSSPHLYTAKATLVRGGQAVDVKLTKFGLRKAEIQGERFLLNGEPVKLNCATDAGYETGTFLRPTPLFDSQRKVKALKDAGFNAIRVPGRLAPRSLVEKGNELGLLVIAEPAMRGANAKLVPILTPAGFVPLPVVDHGSPGVNAERILDAQIRRDRNDPSVIWWGLADASRKLVGRVAALDGDAIVSRNREFCGSNYYRKPGSTRAVRYLRPEIAITVPMDFEASTRILDVGDRDEFAFLVLDCGSGLTDFRRVIAGLGGESWRLESKAFAARAARMQAAFTRDGLGEFFDSLDVMVLESQYLRGEFQRRAIELGRVNVHVGCIAIQNVADAPWAPGTGLFDWFGRPSASHQLATLANMRRRALVIPERRSGEANLAAGLTEVTKVLFGQLVDRAEPIKILQIETRRPDDISGYTNAITYDKFPYLVQAEVGFGGGDGVYVVHPLWIGLEKPEAEQVGLLGVTVPNKPLTRDGPKVVDVAPHLTIAGAVGDLWQDEETFMQVAAALDRAKEGATAALFFALTPDSPLMELGCLPPMTLTPAKHRFHAISGEPVFAKTAIRGPLGDPLNELAPSHTMAGLAASQRWSIAIDENGELAGVNFARVPFGKGSVILTTLPIAEKLEPSAGGRRVVSNLIDMLRQEPAVKLAPSPSHASRMEELRARFRQQKASRGN